MTEQRVCNYFFLESSRSTSSGNNPYYTAIGDTFEQHYCSRGFYNLSQYHSVNPLPFLVLDRICILHLLSIYMQCPVKKYIMFLTVFLFLVLGCLFTSIEIILQSIVLKCFDYNFVILQLGSSRICQLPHYLDVLYGRVTSFWLSSWEIDLWWPYILFDFICVELMTFELPRSTEPVLKRRCDCNSW